MHLKIYQVVLITLNRCILLFPILRNVKRLVSAQTRIWKLWLGTHILFHTQFIWNIIITLTNMENNCMFGTEANFQTVITNFRILYISSSPICMKVVILFLLILNFLFLVSSLHSLWPCSLFPPRVLLSPYPRPALKYFAFNKRLSFCSRCQFQSVGL